MLSHRNVVPENKSQQRLLTAYKHISSRVAALTSPINAEKMLNELKRLEVMEFIEQNDGKAIRIFQTVNDRGKPLSNLEKAKSLLIYYSNRFLDGELDEFVNHSFGSIFNQFNIIKSQAIDNGVTLVSQKGFSEDNVMRYHYLAYHSAFYDYNATINDVLEVFLKSVLKEKKLDSEHLKEFILHYTTDLLLFFNSFADLMNSLNIPRNYKLFSVLKVSTYLYPLIIRLQSLGALNQSLMTMESMDFLDLIETIDVRVYKTRGTDPVKDISFIAKDTRLENLSSIEHRLIGYVKYFMNDDEFASRLKGNFYGNQAQWHIFFELEDFLRVSDEKPKLDIGALKKLNESTPTIEHIYPQERPFSLPDRGFEDDEHYYGKNHKLGNLLVVEKSINSTCKNHLPDKKITDSKMFMSSQFELTRRFAAELNNTGGVFNAENIDRRTEDLASFCLKRWHL